MRGTNDRAAASDAAQPGNDQPDEAEAAGTAAQPAGDEPAAGSIQPGEDQQAELERLRAENAKLRQQAGAGPSHDHLRRVMTSPPGVPRMAW